MPDIISQLFDISNMDHSYSIIDSYEERASALEFLYEVVDVETISSQDLLLANNALDILINGLATPGMMFCVNDSAENLLEPIDPLTIANNDRPTNINTNTIFRRLLDLAGSGVGRPELLDTEEEIELATVYLQRAMESTSLTPEDRDIIALAFTTLQNSNHSNPSAAFRVHPPYFTVGLYPLCELGQSQDCYLPLIPVPEGYYNIFPIYSGAMQGLGDYLDYVFVTESTWHEMVSSMTLEPIKNKLGIEEHPVNREAIAVRTRRQLLEVMYYFDNNVASNNDVPGLLGNFLFFQRWQQDCGDETASLSFLLHSLYLRGYLQGHRFELGGSSVTTEGHVGAQIIDITGEEDIPYAVDLWNGPQIFNLAAWNQENTAMNKAIEDMPIGT